MKNLISTLTLALCSSAIFAQVVSNTSIYIAEGAVVSIGQDFQNNAVLQNKGEVHFKKDLTNEGSIDSEGDFFLDGYNRQHIKGSQAVVLNNVQVHNDVNLENTLRVEKQLHFQNGIIKSTKEAPLVFATEGRHTGAGDVSHVVGTVQKIDAKYFQFPLGDGSMYRAFDAEESKGTLTATYVAQNPFEVSSQMYKGLNQINQYEYWTLQGEDINSEAKVHVASSEYSNDGIAYLSKGSWKLNDKRNFNTVKGLGQGIVFTTGEGSHIDQTIGIWPNPTQGEFNLKLSGMNDTDQVMVDITNSDGRVVMRARGLVKDLRKVYQLPITLPTTELTVRVLNGDERLSEKLLLKR